MRTLALDVGTRHTGVAYMDSEVGIPLPLDTIDHGTRDELIDAVVKLIAERRVDEVIVGLPLLPSGDEGAQVRESRSVADELQRRGFAVEMRDERYTTPKSSRGEGGVPASNFDGNAAAACALLSQKP